MTLTVSTAAIADALFALYVVLGHRVAERGRVGGIDALAGSMIVAAVVVTPLAGWATGPAWGHPGLLAAALGVAVSSSVIPYALDQLAMARLSRPTYALLLALLPATATLVGIAVLTQIPSVIEVAGVAFVIAGIALRRDTPVSIGSPADHERDGPVTGPH